MAFASMISMSMWMAALLLLLPALCISNDRLAPGKNLSPGNTIISDGGEFALGFFSPSNSTLEKLYLGIWYNNIPSLTVVWVANRETPAISSSAPSLALTNNSDLVFFIRNGSLPEWRGSVWTGYTVSSQYFANTSIVIYVAYEDNFDQMSAIFSVSDGAPPVRSVMSYSGRVEVSVWNRNSSEWAMLVASPDVQCSRYGYCGLSGYCDYTDATPTCKCLDGFEPVDNKEWSNAKFSRGCQRKEELRCSDGFLALPDMKVPDNFVRIGRKTLEECAAECSANCSCVAYAYATLNGSTANGDSTRCLVWIGDHQLVDTQKMGVLPYSTAGADTQDTLHLRVASLSGKRLSPGTTIISDGGAFALGFFSPSNSTPEKLYVGIWYNNIPSLTVVWVANWEIPAVSSSAPSLALTNNSELVLSDANGHATPTCKCLDRFEPVDKQEWSNARFSQGCKRKEAPQCSDRFLALPDMKVPDNFVRVGRKALEECVAECSANCSCVAYAYANLNGSTADGDATRCLVWIGDQQLVDTQKMGASPYSNAGAETQETLYLRVAGLSD
nr:unnamed protein product [Digitaria exilis]